MIFTINTLEVFPADCPKHTMFSNHAAYFFKLLFGSCMFYFGLGVPAYSQFIFIEYCYSRHPDVFNCSYNLHKLRCRTVPSLWTLGHD